ncbi:MAG: DUF362 domain-containing protein [Candidatus Methanomethylophilaceae archaeon]|nr:DUF362 domain-containing protein [Candidatus Methanomethylophilaceae archaeon]
MGSEVYFTDLETGYSGSRIEKLDNLIRKSGLDRIDMEKKFVAIKMHFGEMGNLSFLRHNYAKVVVDYVKERGGIPFLTDCNTLYVGKRKHAIEHLETAFANGFNPYSVGCPVIIADGLKGDDDVEIPIDGEMVRAAKIGRSIADADVIITLNHFKCHELTGIGGAIKNLAMGCASRRGKMEQHSEGKPLINDKKCKGCGVCPERCGSDAITISDRKASIDHDKCTGCGMCLSACRFDAIDANMDSSSAIICKKMAEYATAAVLNKPNFHISLAIDITPYCDCHDGNEMYVVPDVGFFASFDPVALDTACADAVNKQPRIAGTMSDRESDRDLFGCIHEITEWDAQTAHAERMGLGVRSYEIKKV